MDKYSRQPNSRLIRRELKRKASDPKTATLTSVGGPANLKHGDYIDNVEQYDVPNHVMLNHLITCNIKMDKVLTGSCIHRYGGKYITQIVYFPIDTEGL